MKHLRRFNESIDCTELHKLGDENLAFLVDKGFSFDILENRYNGGIDFSIFKNSGDGFFTWEEVKYDIIPFLLLLNSKYVVYNINVGIIDNDPVPYNMVEIEDEDTEYLGEISVIEFTLFEK
jgi:hypothetical protein